LGLPLFPSVVIGLMAAVLGAGLVGLVNGVIIAKLKVPAFIVTLGSSFIVRGMALLMSENTTVIGLPPGIRDYGNDALLYYVRGEGGGLYFLQRPEVAGALARRMDAILPYPVVLTALVVALAVFLLRRTQFGRHTYAIGGGLEAAIRTGIPVDRRVISLYVLSAATAGIAGFLSTLRFSAGSAVIGDPLLLSSIAAVIIGGLTAVREMSSDIHRGEVVALLGDNGAGKSTLIKCISGVYHADEGEIFFEGRPARFARPIDARNHGIETIYQDLALANNLDVGANIFLGREIKKRH